MSITLERKAALMEEYGTKPTATQVRPKSRWPF
jgi:hypothetical protein